MKHIDYLYFNIYSYFYRSGPERLNHHARIQAMYFFALGSGGWLLLLESLYLHQLRHCWFTSKVTSGLFAISLYLLTAILSNYIFIVRDRDLKIFGRYDDQTMARSKRKLHFFLSVAILVVPYVLMLSFAIYRKVTAL